MSVYVWTVCVCVCVYADVWISINGLHLLDDIFLFQLFVNCISRTVLYMCIEYCQFCLHVNMFYVSIQGIDEHIVI